MKFYDINNIILWFFFYRYLSSRALSVNNLFLKNQNKSGWSPHKKCDFSMLLTKCIVMLKKLKNKK